MMIGIALIGTLVAALLVAGFCDSVSAYDDWNCTYRHAGRRPSSGRFLRQRQRV